MVRPLYLVVALVLAFSTGAAVAGLYRGPQVRAALARADSLRARADSAQALADSLEGVVQKTDTVRVTAWAGVKAEAKLAPPACTPLITKVTIAERVDSTEIADLRKENAALRHTIALDDSANAALRTAAKKADGALFHLRLPLLGSLAFEQPGIALGVTPDAPLKPKVFISVISVRL